ncbi:MAG: histidine kinase [Marinilabiliaceae bacterium]|nr:histidine kinase [Marinilabiliaceae bacterium]
MKPSQLKKLFIHLLFWLPLPIFLLSTSKHLLFGTFITNEGNFEAAVFYGLVFNAVLFYVTLYQLLPFYFKQRRYFAGLMLSVGFCFVMCVCEALVDYVFISTVYTPSNLKGYEDSVLQYALLSSIIMNMPIFILSVSCRFVKDWYTNEKAKQKLKEEKLISELQFLKSQVNPHFLFNTLNNLFGMARQAKALSVADGIVKLSNMMRYMLYDSESEFVSLEKEISYLHDYIELQKLRIGTANKMDLQVDLNACQSQLKIAPLLLIPFVENAFKHGISVKEPSKISIGLHTDENTVTFKVSNSINKLRQNRHEDSSGFGLKNVQKRLDLIYPDRSHLDIKEEEDIYSISLNITTTL